MGHTASSNAASQQWSREILGLGVDTNTPSSSHPADIVAEGSPQNHDEHDSMRSGSILMRERLVNLQTTIRLKQNERLRRIIGEVITLTMHQVRHQATVEVALHASLLQEIMEALPSASKDDLVWLSNMLVITSPFSLNTSFGILPQHLTSTNMNGPRRIASRHYAAIMKNEHTKLISQLATMLLDTDWRTVRQVVFAFSMLVAHPNLRNLEQKPQGLSLLCSDRNPFVQYYVATALGNLCLGAIQVNGQQKSTSGIQSVMRTGVPHLIKALLNPSVELYVVEAILYALFCFVREKPMRELIGQTNVVISGMGLVQVDFARHSSSGTPITPEDGPRPPMPTRMLSGGSNSFPIMHVLFALLRLPRDIEISAVQSFGHLRKAGELSDLAFTLACLVICELANAPENIHLLRAFVWGDRPRHNLQIDNRIRQIGLMSAGTSSGDLSSRPIKTFGDVLLKLVKDRSTKRFSPAGVALAASTFWLTDRDYEFDSFVDSSQKEQINMQILPLVKVFSRQTSQFGFDKFWAGFRVAPGRASARSQMLQDSVISELCGGANFKMEKFLKQMQAYFRVLNSDRSGVQGGQDADFNEFWIAYFQGLVLDRVESILPALQLQETQDGHQDLGRLNPYFFLLAKILRTCIDAQVFSRAVQLITQLATSGISRARLLFKYGAVRLLVRMLWLISHEQGYLVVKIVESERDDTDESVITQTSPTEGDDSMFPESSSAELAGAGWNKRMERSIGATLLSATGQSNSFRARMLDNRIFVGADLQARCRQIQKVLGPTLLLRVLEAVNAFTRHDELRLDIGIHLRLRGLLFKLYTMFQRGRMVQNNLSSSRLGASRANAGAVNINPPLEGLLAPFSQEEASEIFDELAIGVGSLAPVNHSLTRQNWTTRENIDLMRHLVDAAASGATRDGSEVSLAAQYKGLKAISALENITRSRGIKPVLLSHTNLLYSLTAILEHVHPGTLSGDQQRAMALLLLRNLTASPHGLLLWLKFDTANRAAIDSSGRLFPTACGDAAPDNAQFTAYRKLPFSGSLGFQMGRLQSGSFARFHGMERNVHNNSHAIRLRVGRECWGVNFADNYVVVFDEEELVLGQEWSIGVWFLCECSDHSIVRDQHNQDCFTLVQCFNGDRPICILRRQFVDDPEETSFELGAYCSSTQTWHGSGIDLDKIVPGWHHLLVVGSGGRSMFYLDGSHSVPCASIDFQPIDDVCAIGNSTSQDEPWGVAADLRIYPFAFARDPQDWDFFVDSRTWGLDCYPDVDNYPLPSPSEALHIGYARPVEHIRFITATFQQGVIMNLLINELEQGTQRTLSLQISAAQILGDLALCTVLRNRVFCSKILSYFAKFVAQDLPLPPSPSRWPLQGQEIEETPKPASDGDINSSKEDEPLARRAELRRALNRLIINSK